MLNFLSAMVGAFFKWVFIRLFTPQRNVSFKDVLWGKNKKVSFLDYDMSLSFYGIIVIILIVSLILWIMR